MSETLEVLKQQAEAEARLYPNGNGPVLDAWPHYTLDEGLQLYQAQDDWLFYGLYQQDSIGMLFGDGAAGKTYLAINQAVCLAAGVSWLGDYPATEPKNVIYFISEGRRHFFFRLLAAVNGLAIATGNDTARIKALVNQNLLVVTDVPQLYAKNATKSIDAYLTYWQNAGGIPLDFAIIDTLHRAAVGSDENSEKDANIILENCRRFVIETGAGVELVHHVNRAGGYRGSSAYRSDCDVMIKVEGQDRAPRTITIDKEKDCPEDGPVSGTQFEMQFYIDSATGKSYVATSGINQGGVTSKAEQAKPEIHAIISSNPNGLSQNQIVALVKRGGRNSVLSALREMVQAGDIEAKPGSRNSIIYLPG